MLYPVIVHTGDGPGYSAVIPDFPGTFTAGEDMEELVANVQEAVELYMEDAGSLPEASSLEAVAASPDAEGGVVALLPVDTGFLDKRVERISLTLRAAELTRIDREADRLGLTRSAYMVLCSLPQGKKRGGPQRSRAARSGKPHPAKTRAASSRKP